MEDLLLQDILEQPDALATALARLTTPDLASRIAALGQGADQIIFTGMGASYHACYPTVQRLLQAGRHVAWLETGELSHFTPSLCAAANLLVMVSQSGRTAEIVHLLPRLPEGRRLIAVTNEPRSPLGEAADIVLPLHAGHERAVCATKTFTCSLLALDVLADALLAGSGATRRWPPAIAAVQQALTGRAEWLPPLLGALQVPAHLWVLARGPALSAAMGGALIIKESSRLHAEGMSSPQFRHGPLEAAAPGRCALMLATSGPLATLDQDLAAEMVEAGMTVAAVSTDPAGAWRASGTLTITLPPAPAGLEAVVQVLPAQLLARAFVLAQGRTPGEFTRIAKVTIRE